MTPLILGLPPTSHHLQLDVKVESRPSARPPAMTPTKPYPFPTSSSPAYHTAIRFLTAANNWDFDALRSLLAPNFTSQAWPSSLRTASDPINAEEYLARSEAAKKNLFVTLGFILFPLVNVLEGADGQSIMIQLNSRSVLHSGATWEQEWLQIFRFDEDGKVVRHEEWQDAGRMEELYRLAGKEGPEA